jgi:hypothetical protein
VFIETPEQASAGDFAFLSQSQFRRENNENTLRPSALLQRNNAPNAAVLRHTLRDSPAP